MTRICFSDKAHQLFANETLILQLRRPKVWTTPGPANRGRGLAQHLPTNGVGFFRRLKGNQKPLKAHPMTELTDQNSIPSRNHPC